jgi:hypothetical protein
MDHPDLREIIPGAGSGSLVHLGWSFLIPHVTLTSSTSGKVLEEPDSEATILTLYTPGSTLAFQIPTNLYPEVRSRLVLATSEPSGPFTMTVQRRALSAVCAALLDCDVLPEELS